MTLKEKLREMLADESIQERLDSIEDRIDGLEDMLIYEEFEGEEREIRITKEVYNEMCEYLGEDEIELMGLT